MLANRKDKQRREMLALRDQMPAPLQTSLSQELVSYAALLSPIFDGKIISAFLPIRSEIDTRPLIAHLREKGASLALPALVGDKPNRHIVFRAFEAEHNLIDMDLGTSGPPETAPIVDPHLIFLPLAVYDRAGNRIGYGGGHYDRAIAKMRARGLNPKLIGLAFSCQEIEEIAAEPHDIKLDAILTEKGLTFFEQMPTK